MLNRRAFSANDVPKSFLAYFHMLMIYGCIFKRPNADFGDCVKESHARLQILYKETHPRLTQKVYNIII